MNDRFHAEIADRVKREGFARKMGIELEEIAPGYAVVEMVPGDGDLNMFGTVHGGAIFALADEAFQVSCNSHGTVAVALNVNLVYHGAPVAGERLRAESREVHRSRKTATYAIRVTGPGDRLVASCQAVAYRKGVPLPFPENAGGC